MIDLHSHILHGLDDGPDDLEGSLAMARAAVAQGTTTIAATPHIRDDHPFPLDAIQIRVDELNSALAKEGIDLKVVPGGELAISKIPDLDDAELRGLGLAGGRYLLVESPYTHTAQLLEHVLFDLQAKGFRPLLAHPERSPAFLTDEVRLRRLVERGVLCSVTALSMQGGFGGHVQDFCARLFTGALVHNVASDSHSATQRPPGLATAFQAFNAKLPGLLHQQDWFTRDVPEAVLSDRELPPRLPAPTERRRGWRRLLSSPAGSLQPRS
jgi:protein-tyrosine phosphatase